MQENKIPKIIHYCWFGGNPLPESAKKCIASWKRYCPDFEIKRWDESNFDFSNVPLYVKQAYEAKKWAFVSDYVRLAIVYENGGIYLDTDVELLKSLEPFLGHRAYFGCEGSQIATGLGFGAEKGTKILQYLMKDYETIPFIKADGKWDETPCPERNTKVFLRCGYTVNGEKFVSEDGTVLYPQEFFAPKNSWTNEIHLTENTVSIHHYSASWISEEKQFCKKTEHRLLKFMPEKYASYLAFFLGRVKYQGFFVALRSAKKYL